VPRKNQKKLCHGLASCPKVEKGFRSVNIEYATVRGLSVKGALVLPMVVTGGQARIGMTTNLSCPKQDYYAQAIKYYRL